MASPDPGLRNQESVRSLLRIGGWIAISVGIVLTAIALIDFFSAFGSFGAPTNFWLAFIGLPLIAIGSWMLKAGYLGPASRYLAGEVTPTLRDTLGALGVGSGQLVCASCGGANAPDAKFCDDCGRPLARRCASCGADNAGDATFCRSCGAELTSAS
jgi:ribosomal protein L40E